MSSTDTSPVKHPDAEGGYRLLHTRNISVDDFREPPLSPLFFLSPSTTPSPEAPSCPPSPTASPTTLHALPVVPLPRLTPTVCAMTPHGAPDGVVVTVSSTSHTQRVDDGDAITTTVTTTTVIRTAFEQKPGAPTKWRRGWVHRLAPGSNRFVPYRRSDKPLL